MKTIYIIIATFYVGLFTKAQQSELINNTWYLQKMINSNGAEMLSPNNNEVNYVIANFGNSEMNTKVIYEFYGSLFGSGTGALTDTTIIYDEFFYNNNATDCQIPENCLFQNSYFFFFGYGFPMNYKITNENNYLKLTLTNNSGNKAVYLSQKLSTFNIEDVDTKIYPNPIKDILSISSKFSELDIQLYDMMGKLILSKKIKKNADHKIFELDMTKIQTGIYVIKIINTDKKIIYTSKIAKE